MFALLGFGAIAFAVAGFVGLGTLLAVLGIVALGWNRAEHLVLATLGGIGQRQRAVRRGNRERLLVSSPSGQLTLAELTRLVDEIERRGPERARAFDLEALLDRYSNLTVAYDQALRAASMADRGQLEHIREHCRIDPAIDPRRWDLAERRVKCLDACEAVRESIADELAIVAETIRLIAQRVACPESPVRDDLIARQLAELDESDAARHELALLCDDSAPKDLPEITSACRAELA